MSVRHSQHAPGSDLLDGNVLAGPLAELFVFDVTTALERCASCSDVEPLARAIVYGSPMGWVVRCPTCEEVLMVMVRTGERYSLTARGMSWVRVAR
ncbi:DUF6510 family protein [Rathayibacter soli]|uniref:DUF6510 family protein n=1 Tax=Rathayibacter soli TaxID=3144168 RepID=UPI0027E3F4F1|nr:DUF6510 family protein [Glaciibacter superstes]